MSRSPGVRARVFCTRALAPAAARLLTDAGVTVEVASSTRPEAVAAEVAGADVLIVRDPLPAGIFDRTPRLRAAIRHGTGLDMIPVGEATAAGILVVRFHGVNAPAVAEHVMMVTAAMARSLLPMDRDLRAVGWDPARARAVSARELGGLTMGIVGTGAVARAVRRIAADGFGMSVLACGSGRGPVPEGMRPRTLDELLAESDVVVLACALTERTRGLLDARALALVRPGALLVNISRAAVVEEDALLAALRAGRIAGAALDVFAQEPLPAGHPYLREDRLLLTPHTAGLSWQSADRLGRLAARAALDVLAGRLPEGEVNADAAGWCRHAGTPD